MQTLDYIVILVYLLGLAGVAITCSRLVRSSSDMFQAGGRSPWWVSGLSSFMTMFSAGTFVVWGGIAYRYGLVAVSISMCYGVAAIGAGLLLGWRWRRLGVSSAAEFIELRFGSGLVRFYTWVQGIFYMFTAGGAIYGLAVIVCALVVIPQGSALMVLSDPQTLDPVTGAANLSVSLTSIAVLGVVVLIAFSGGLWGVLVTDVLQFIVLTCSVVVVVPLILMHPSVGGLDGLVREAPQGVFALTAGSFTWWFLALWVAVHFFKIGAEWAFVQRFTCVPSERDAVLSGVLFGVMYLLSPVLWMMPPIAFRLIRPLPEGVDPASTDAVILGEQAYILACQSVLPAGMVGLMVAAMISATASMATTQLNVYAGAFTRELATVFRIPRESDRAMVWIGRALTVALGVLILAGALVLNKYKWYTEYVLATTALIVPPLLIPTLWGLYSRRIGSVSAWAVALAGLILAVIAKTGCIPGGWMDGLVVARWYQSNGRVGDLLIGSVPPLAILALAEITGLLSRSGTQAGWDRVDRFRSEHIASRITGSASTLPATISGWTVAAIALLMALIALLVPSPPPTAAATQPASDRSILLAFAGLLAVIAAVVLLASRFARSRLGGADNTGGTRRASS